MDYIFFIDGGDSQNLANANVSLGPYCVKPYSTWGNTCIGLPDLDERFLYCNNCVNVETPPA